MNNLSSRKTVLWKTYNAANPVQTARHADCTLILNGITECLPEFFQDKDRTRRTRLIKDTLARLGNSKGYLFHCNGLETQDAPKESELLYDFMWYTRAPDDRYVITSCPLIAECEWKSKRKKDSPTPYSGLIINFENLTGQKVCPGIFTSSIITVRLVAGLALFQIMEAMHICIEGNKQKPGSYR